MLTTAHNKQIISSALASSTSPCSFPDASEAWAYVFIDLISLIIPPTLTLPTQISFGAILVPLGLGMLFYGFGGFFQLLPGGDISSLLLIYGFVISLLGFALAYAQLEPVPCLSTAGAVAARETQCTDIQKQVRFRV